MLYRVHNTTLQPTHHFNIVFSIFTVAAILILMSFTQTSASELKLSLSAGDGNQIAGFRLYYKSDSNNTLYDGTGIDQGPSPLNISADSSSETQNAVITLTGLKDETNYSFIASAYDANGKESALSNEVSYTTPAPEPVVYHITCSSNGNGAITPAGNTDVVEGESVTYSIAADPSYVIDDVQIDGTSIGAVGSYTFADVSENHTISASFSPVVQTQPSLPDETDSDIAKIWLEAEDGSYAFPMVGADDSDASNGAYMWVPNGQGNFWGPSEKAGRLEISFEVSVPGYYAIWGRVKSISSQDNSFFVSVDDSEAFAWHTMVSQEQAWTWNVVGAASPQYAMDATGAKTFWLEAGTHTIALAQREDGTQIDRILICNDLYYVPQQMGEQPEIDLPKIWMEAEDGIYRYPMVVAADTNASSEAYVWVPNGQGNFWGPSEEAGMVEIPFEVPVSGDYIVWGRIMASSSQDDSFFLSIDDNEDIAWHALNKNDETWTWNLLGAKLGSDGIWESSGAKVFWLEAGPHTMFVSQREDGTKLDKILVTKDLQYVPQQLGETSESMFPKIWLEAEEGVSNLPMTAAADANASAGEYMWVPNGSGNFWSPSNEAGRLELQFDVPVAGDYIIWGRIGSKNTNDNSFFIAVDGEDALTWSTVPGGESWTWNLLGAQPASDGVIDTSEAQLYWFEKGSHQITIFQREDGTKIDRILVTSDLGYDPQEEK